MKSAGKVVSVCPLRPLLAGDQRLFGNPSLSGPDGVCWATTDE